MDVTNSLANVLIARRLQCLSLTESYARAVNVAGIPAEEGATLLKLIAVSNKILSAIEHDGRQLDSNSHENYYHNRQHLADAVLSMGYFLGHTPWLDVYERQLLLLVMLVHDFGHRGIANKLANLSHEEESISLLAESPIMQLPPEDQIFIEECILGTKPDQIQIVIEQYQANPNNSFAYMRALVNDADIAASFIDPLGLELSALILKERGILAPTQIETLEALSVFKNRAHITTPVARKLLGLEP